MNPWIILAALTAVVGAVFVARAVRPRRRVSRAEAAAEGAS